MFGRKINYQKVELPVDLDEREKILRKLEGAKVKVVLAYKNNFGETEYLKDKGKLTLSYPERNQRKNGILIPSFGLEGKVLWFIPALSSYSIRNLTELHVDKGIETSWMRG